MIFYQAIQRNAAVFSDRIATRFNGRDRTWSEFEQRVARLATGLRAQGLEPGDRVAILALNSDRYLEYYYATAWAGVVMVPLNIRWSLKENQYALQDSESVMLLVDDTFLEMGKQLHQAADNQMQFVYIGENEPPQGMHHYEDFVAGNEPMIPHQADAKDMLGIYYTGGTTGFPKGVMLSHENVWTSSMAFAFDSKLNAREEGVSLIAAPMFHLAAGAICWSSVLCGATLSIIPAFNVEGLLESIKRDKVTDTLLVPTMINLLLQSPALTDSDTSTLGQIFYGASPMPEGTLKEAMEKLPHVGFCQVYGQTELSPAGTIMPPEYHVLSGPKAGKIKAAGRPFVCMTVQIQDPQGNPLPPGERGEICFKGPNVMMGYLNKPEQTAETIREGWLHTGDAGYQDEEGFIYLVDRVKDMIISGGENVYSAEVESAISNHPDVTEVVVIGIPSAEWGESVHAIVRLKEGRQVTEDEIIATCREYIAGYKVPRSVEIRIEPFPVTGAGKLQKNVLREPFWKGKDRQIN